MYTVHSHIVKLWAEPDGPSIGGAENTGLENAGVAKMQGWKTRDWKMQESEKYGKRRFHKCVSDCTD